MPQRTPESRSEKTRGTLPAALRRCLLLLLLLSSLSAACVRSNDAPPSPDTEEPPAHSGCYVSEYGNFRFHGDGSHLTAALLLPDGRELSGDMYYRFQWEHHGVCRYDVASLLVLAEENSGDTLCEFQVLSASEECIFLCYFADDVQYEFTLKKQEGITQGKA